MSTPVKNNQQQQLTRTFIPGGISCMDLYQNNPSPVSTQKKANKMAQKQNLSHIKMASLDQDIDLEIMENSDQDEETTHKMMMPSSEQTPVKEQTNSKKRKRFIQQIDVQSEDLDDEETHTTKKMPCISDLQEENSREFTFRFFTKSSNDSKKLVHTVEETETNTFVLYGGEKYSNIKSIANDTSNIPKKTMEIGSFNSFAIGSDNQIYNLIDKKSLFHKNGDNLYAMSEDEILSKLNEDPEKNNKLNPVQKKKIICNCKKSKCLKLYCECFQNGEECNEDCNCCDCENNEEHQEILIKARQEQINKNPNAFQSKVKETNNQLEHFKGCNCKKSGCLKKYCECYNAGIQCTKHCKCEGCKNGTCKDHEPTLNTSVQAEQHEQPSLISQFSFNQRSMLHKKSQQQQQIKNNYNMFNSQQNSQGYPNFYHHHHPNGPYNPHQVMHPHMPSQHVFGHHHHTQRIHPQYFQHQQQYAMQNRKYEQRNLFNNKDSQSNISINSPVEKIEDKENYSTSNSLESSDKKKKNNKNSFLNIVENRKQIINSNKKSQNNINQQQQQLISY